MKITLHRRHGQNPAGTTRDYPDVTGQWLIDNGFGVAADGGSRSPARAPEKPAVEKPAEPEPVREPESEPEPSPRAVRAASKRRSTRSTGGARRDESGD